MVTLRVTDGWLHDIPQQEQCEYTNIQTFILLFSYHILYNYYFYNNLNFDNWCLM